MSAISESMKSYHKKKPKSTGCLIDHESMPAILWKFLMFFFSMCTSFLYAILAAYRDPVDPLL
jgi:hypothetical protein